MVSPDPLPSNPDWDLDDLEALVDHVTRFSLAGIRAIRSQTKNAARGENT
jgi:hypothetical protein